MSSRPSPRCRPRACGPPVGPLDVGDGPALQSWVRDVATELGGIDIVVSNVSALAIGGDEEHWQSGFQIDMMGTVRLVDAAMPIPRGVGGAVHRHHLERVGPRDRLRVGRLRRVQGGPGALHPGPRLPPRGHGDPGQHGLAGQHLLRGRCLGPDRDGQPRAVRAGARPQPHGAHGHTTGDGERRGVHRQPRGRASSPAPTSSSTAPSPRASNSDASTGPTGSGGEAVDGAETVQATKPFIDATSSSPWTTVTRVGPSRL